LVKLTDYIRKSSRYLRADEVRDGEVVEIVSEGRLRPAEESRFGRETFELDVRLPDGSEKVWTLNKTTLRRLAEAYGDDTKSWVGRKVRLTVETVIVRKEPRQVIFGYPVGAEEEAVKQLMESLARAMKGDRVDSDTLERVLRNVRGLDISAEEAARIAGLKVVEEGGKKYVMLRS
jgi:hypothetical protein